MNNFNILHLMSRSLQKKKINIFTAFPITLTARPDNLTISETWLPVINKEYFQLPGFHSYHLVINSRTQGGVSIFVCNHIKSIQIEELRMLNDFIKTNTIRINIHSATYILCTIQRHHSIHEAVEYFDILCTLLRNDVMRNNKIVITGDLNMNLLDNTTHYETNDYLAALKIYNFFRSHLQTYQISRQFNP